MVSGKKRYRVAVAGCSGYAGGEILRLLSAHPQVDIGSVTAKQSVGKKLYEVQPHLAALRNRIIEPTTPEILAQHDVVFLALPHGSSGAIAKELPDDILIIDAGADFRLTDPAEWVKYYHSEHQGSWVYGLPELPKQRAAIAHAKRIAVPGCHPTAATLGLLPGIVSGLLSGKDLSIVSNTGPSGAGKTLKTQLLAAELIGNITPYSMAGTHRHIPEIRQNLIAAGAKHEPSISFTPVLVPTARGILTICTAPIDSTIDTDEAKRIWQEFYVDEPFVFVLEDDLWPQSKATIGANSCQIQVAVDQDAGRLVVVSAIDNLGKGTAGAAIQCLNLALGVHETIGLTTEGVAP